MDHLLSPDTTNIIVQNANWSYHVCTCFIQRLPRIKCLQQSQLRFPIFNLHPATNISRKLLPDKTTVAVNRKKTIRRFPHDNRCPFLPTFSAELHWLDRWSPGGSNGQWKPCHWSRFKGWHKLLKDKIRMTSLPLVESFNRCPFKMQ